jgi:4-amino-4-deoxy-L-arabinose transferase-like glycosyltransferase
MNKLRNHYVLIAILVLAALLRLYGLNWDQGHHLHPDERFLTMVVNAMQKPSSLLIYLNPSTSTFNPNNVGFDFFVYGTFPLILVRLISSFVHLDIFDYNNVTLVGRMVSASFDIGVVALVFLIGRRVFSRRVGSIGSLFYAASVLPIQQSHFFTVDTFLVFFVALTFYFLLSLMSEEHLYIYSILIGISFGLALASKVSVLLFFPILILGFCFYLLKTKHVLNVLVMFGFFFFSCYLTLRFADPYLFANSSFTNPAINLQFLDNLKQLQSYKGVIYSAVVNASVIKSLLRKKLIRINKMTVKQYSHVLMLFWVIFLFSYQSVQYVKAMRYFLYIYPFLALLAANFYFSFFWKRNWHPNIKHLVLLMLFIYPLSFLSIYFRPHSRVMASEWIYNNIPVGSIISCEYWDDCLPLPINGKSSTIYKTEVLKFFDPDTSEKWNLAKEQLDRIDYLILSSNRLWGSIPKVPDKYPVTSKFYEDLFSSKLQFTKVAQISSFPTVPLLNIQIPDDNAEESFTVYDHPQVIIYKKSI